MNTVVIYQSHYGSTETYAKWLAEDLNADLRKANQVKTADLQNYDTIIYGGGLYAGGVNGIGFLTKNLESIKEKSLYLFTVGSSDMTNPENIAAIRSTLEKKLPPAIWKKLHLYHLQGGMHYSKMSFFHRTMMNMMMNMLRKKPEGELRSDERDMLAAAGQDMDFTDRMALTPLVADIEAERFSVST